MRSGTSDAVRSALAVECERALVAGARARCGASRQTLRAAARRFVRRHRSDSAQLRWVLRSVAASSALAVSLLGLGAEPVHAKATLFTALTGAENPLDGQDVGLFSAPAFGDLDGDGDDDLVAGARAGGFVYFENSGNADSPVFVPRTGAANPLGGQDVGLFSVPALGDLDGDGDLDLVSGEESGVFFSFENTGSAIDPAFVQRTGAQNPLDGRDVGFSSTPALGDLDGDGDLDLVAGEYGGSLRYFVNTGSATAPAFVPRTGSTNPLGAVDLDYYSAPALGDLDRDGDLDLVGGAVGGDFAYFENTGSITNPAFAPLADAANPLDGEGTGAFSTPALADLDGDDDLDLVAGSPAGSFSLLENESGRLVERAGPNDPVAGLQTAHAAYADLDADGDLDLVTVLGFVLFLENTGSTDAPAFVPLESAVELYGLTQALGWVTVGDLDRDGDFDIVVGLNDLDPGQGGGGVAFLYNSGTPSTPAFTIGASPPGFFASSFDDTAPSLGDLDGDGDLDLMTASSGGSFTYFENTGSTTPAFDPEPISVQGGFGSGHTRPALGDLDGDGDLDLVWGNDDGLLEYHENTGGRLTPAFVRRTGTGNPLGGHDLGFDSAPALADLDGDGDLDVVGYGFETAYDTGLVSRFYETALVKPSLSAFELTGGANPLAGVDVGDRSVPAAVDLDGDGDLDLVSGDIGGTLSWFENTADAARPAFVARTGSANPFDGLGVSGGFSAPSFGDLDGDGDPDLVAADAFGTFSFFENTGSVTAPAFAPQTGAANPLGGIDAGGISRPALGDLDGDGDLDLVVGEYAGIFVYFENTGSATSPAFAQRTGAANPLDGQDVGIFAGAALGDLDRDGDLDLLAGNNPGLFFYFENTGSATSPAFVARTGGANPLGGEDVGFQAAPSLGDLDGDGDLDLVSGEQFGGFRTYSLPEPGRGALLGAGLALLAWLRRLRDR